TTGKIAYMPPGLGAIVTNEISKTYAPKIVWGEGTWLQQKAGLTGDNALLTFSGSISASTNLASGFTAAEGTNKITLVSGGVATRGIVAGDYIRIGQNIVWDTESGRATEYMGQGLRVQYVSGDDIYTYDTLAFDYLQANSGKVWKITPISGVFIDGIEMRGRGYPGDVASETSNDGTFRGHHMIDLVCAQDVYVNATFRKCRAMGLNLSNVIDAHVQVYAEDFGFEAGNSGAYGYGVAVEKGSANIYVEVIGNRVRHAFTTNGVANEWSGPNNIVVTGKATDCWCEGFDTHPAGSNIIFKNVHSHGNRGNIPVNITSIVGASGTVTVTTDKPHNFEVGSSAIISGTTNFNGTKTVATITSATVFTYSAATVASESTGKVNGDIGHRGGGIQLRCPKVFVD